MRMHSSEPVRHYLCNSVNLILLSGSLCSSEFSISFNQVGFVIWRNEMEDNWCDLPMSIAIRRKIFLWSPSTCLLHGAAARWVLVSLYMNCTNKFVCTIFNNDLIRSCSPSKAHTFTDRDNIFFESSPQATTYIKSVDTMLFYQPW